MEIHAKETLVGAKKCSHCSFQDLHSLSKENQISLVRIHFFPRHVHEVKSADLRIRGGKIILPFVA